MLFGHKNRFQVDVGDLQSEKENLSSFLQSNLNVSIAPVENKLIVDSEKLSVLELQQIVAKYVYRHNLSRTHWVSVKDKTVKINRFKGVKKKRKTQEKHTS